MTMIIIEGMNRTEFCVPKSKDVDRRRFYETRGMLYRAYPDQFTKMRIVKYGVEVGTDEVIVYQENSIHPQVERGTRITYDKMMADIDEMKIITGSKDGKRAFAHISSKTRSTLSNLAPFILVGAVLVYALIKNGGL